uniref:FAM50A/XAP5 C-terminal domain-containing protein n=1 Tax=Globisporangium ultimum (strain ATCC 200006 / CBS 805.95 / DAOM BR144) TaxID=431595 RepID=K3WKT1_GLOUD
MASNIERYKSSGVHTVEGNLAGSRAAKLSKQREQQQQEYEQKKHEIQQTHQRGARIDANFESHRDDDETEFKRQTVGLVTAEEFRRKRENLQNRKDAPEEIKVEAKKPKKKRKAKKMGPLSFDLDGDENDGAGDGNNAFSGDEDEGATLRKKKKKITKNPHVATDFLPDKEREQEEARERERLRAEWEAEQERIKSARASLQLALTGYVYIPKKTTIGKYLELVKQQLVNEFAELRGVSSDNLLYVKEDLIIPHSYSFYDLIVTKARGKSGPLFHFDVHEDVRLIHDARVEKDESHPGKVVERHWYEKNKHIFPASRWEVR